MGTNGVNSVYNSFYNINKNVGQTTPVPVVQKDENVSFQNQPVASMSLGDVQQPYQPKPTGTALKWGVGIGSTVLVLGALSILFTRGGTGKYAKKIAEWSQKLDRSIQEKTAKKASLTPLEKGKLALDKGARKVLHGMKVVTNFTPYKDTAFGALFTNKFSRKLHLDKIPQWCERFSRSITMRTNTKYARNAINNADDLFAYIKKLPAKDINKKVTIDGVEKTVGQWLEAAREQAEIIQKGASNTFGTTARTARIESIDAGLTEMKLPEQLKSKLFPNIFGKEKFTQGIKSISSSTKDGYITENLTSQLRENVAKGLQESCKPTNEAVTQLEKILKGVYPEAEVGSHLSAVQRFSKAFKKAAKFEEGVYLRQAELKAGAAFTDLASLGLLAGTGVYATATQDTHEKTVSKALTFGIPIVGTAGLCLFQTSMGLTGILPLAIAIAGGKLLNICGSAVSDKYIASTNSQKQFMDELAALRLAVSSKANPFASGQAQV